MRVTIILLVLTVAVFIAGNPMSLALYPVYSDSFRPWQLLTYALLHGNVIHLLVNLLALLSFGPALERAWGRWRFLSCYVIAAMIAGALQASISQMPVVGASGALFGLFGAYVMRKPKAKIATLWPAPVEAWRVLTVMVVLTILAWAFGWAANVAHAAHLGGLVVGMTYALNDKPRR